VSLLDKLKLDELNQVLRDLPFNRHRPVRSEIVHFCEHDGICINFTVARTTWHALAPCALKPWWLFLEPRRKNINKDMQNETRQQQEKHTDTIEDTIKETKKQKITTKNADSEVTENA